MSIKRMKLFLVILFTCSIMFTGCSQKVTNQQIDSTIKERKQNEEIIELRFYNGETEDPWTDPVAQAITKATGVKLKVEYGISSDDQKIALMIAEQDYPDMIFAKDQGASLVDAGAMIDLTELIEKYGPNIKKMYGDEFNKLKYSMDDPSIYFLSSYSVGGTIYQTDGPMQMQWDVLKENNYEYPKSLEAYEKMLKDYIATNPTTDDGLETIGLTLSAADWRWMITLGNPGYFITGGTQDNGQWHVDENYNAQYHFFRPEEKEYYRWLNKMYNEGVLDSEFATQTHEDYVSKIASGRVLSLMDAIWDYSDAEKILKADGKLGKTYAGLPFTSKEDMKCGTLSYKGLITGSGIGISTSCKDPIAAIKFLDFMCSEEGNVLRNWGIKDVNYFVDDKGIRYRTEEEIQKADTDKDYGKKTGVGFHIYPFPVFGAGVLDSTGNSYTTKSKEAVIAEYNEEQIKGCKAWNTELLIDIFPQQEEFEIPSYSPSWAYTKPAEYTEISNQLDEIAWSGLISSVICSENQFDATYDKMLSDIEAAGMKEAGEILSSIIKERVAITGN